MVMEMRAKWVSAALVSLLASVAVVPSTTASSPSPTTIPAPIVISPSQYWEGNDGPWSSFTVQVGTPAQDVRVLISTAASATWVVLPLGCVANGPPNCPDLRGQEFNSSASSTWTEQGIYSIELESNLNISDTAEFGFDTVALGWQGSGEPILDHQVVAGIATTDFWLGVFGLTPRPTNFTNFNDPQPSFLETLLNKSMIPSLSWSYTAGAQYRGSGTFGSLVLGGFDASKAGPANMSIAFAGDISRGLTVAIQTITTSIEGQTFDLLPEGIFSFIDSTTPYIWLPLTSCQYFEKAFGLIWDDNLELYLVNDTLHSILVNKNSSVVFQIGNATQGGQTIDITLPYASFDLWVDYPIVSNRTRYFPLMRATNETQYTLGRTFLQEAYITADYNREYFYLSQTNFDPAATEHIVTISPPSHASSGHTGSPIALIVGIAIGCLVIGIALAVAFFIIRKRRAAQKSSDVPSEPPPPDWYPPDKKDEYENPTGIMVHKAELDARDSMVPGVELGGGERYEIADMHNPAVSSLPSPEALSQPVFEMPGHEISVQEMPSPQTDNVSPIDRVPSPMESMPSPIAPLPSLEPERPAPSNPEDLYEAESAVADE